jgi:hypothetical protein
MADGNEIIKLPGHQKHFFHQRSQNDKADVYSKKSTETITQRLLLHNKCPLCKKEIDKDKIK